jgi:hypothetical protein
MNTYTLNGPVRPQFNYMGDAKEVINTGVSAVGAAAAGPIGAAVGAAIGNIIGNLFGSGPSSWDNSGPGVHDWFTKFGEQAYLDWARANEPRAFGSVDAAKAYYLVWDNKKYNRWHYLRDPDRHPSDLAGFFRAIGIDLLASQARALARSGQVNSLKLPDDIVPLGAPVEEAIVGAIDNTLAGNPTAGDDRIIGAMEDAENGGDSGGGGLGALLPLVLFFLMK